jgi:23S rRNA pseudouridine2604 synthase
MDIRLNKYISETGFCSRRIADAYIEDGRVTIWKRSQERKSGGKK